MRLSLKARLLFASFIALGFSLIFFGGQVFYDSQFLSMSFTQVVKADTRSSPPELSNIELSNCTLYPTFSPPITSYTATVPSNVTFITFTITPAYPDLGIAVYPVTVIWGGPVGFSLYHVGENTLYIEVTNGETTQIYRVTVTRLPFMLNLPIIYAE